MPFLADRRLVILADPCRRYTTPSARKRFCEFLGKTPDTARLVICESMDAKEAGKHWLLGWAGKNHQLVQVQAFMLPKPNEMSGWISRVAQERAGRIERKAADKLAEMVGADTRQASQEIDKLLAYANWNRPITLQDVEAVSVFTAEQSMFDFVDALSLGNGSRAQSLLHRLLETEEAFALWGMVIRQFRLLIQAREILDGRGNEGDVARSLGVHPFVAEKSTAQAKRYSMQQLEDIYRRLLANDEDVKTGRIPLDLALDLVVMDLAG
jgi:DNA polymerase-3 subunit delta